MKRILFSVLKDFFIAVLIIFFFYKLVLYAKIDDYYIKTIVKPILAEYGVDSNTIVFKYVFPLTLKAENVYYGEKSFFKEIKITASPSILLKKGTVSFFKIQLNRALIYKTDIDGLSFNKKKGLKEKKRVVFDINSILLNDIYFVYGKNNFVKVKNGDFSVHIGYNDKEFYIRELILSNRTHSININDSEIVSKNGNWAIDLPIKIDKNAHLLIKGDIKNGIIDIATNLSNLNLNGLISPFSGRIDFSGGIVGDLEKPYFAGNISMKNVRYKGMLLENGKYFLRIDKKNLILKNIKLISGNSKFSGTLNYAYKGNKSLSGVFKFKGLNIGDFLMSKKQLKSSLTGVLRIVGKGKTWHDFSGAVALEKFSGEINGELIKKGDFEVRKKGSYFHIEKAELFLNKGRINFDGDYKNDFYNFSFNIENLDMAKIFNRENLSGILNLNGVLNRDKKGVSFIGMAKGKNIKYKSFSLKKIYFISSYEKNSNVNLFYYGFKKEKKMISRYGTLNVEFDRVFKNFAIKNSKIYISNKNYFTINMDIGRKKSEINIASFTNKIFYDNKVVTIKSDEIKYFYNNNLFIKNILINDGENDLNFSIFKKNNLENTAFSLKGVLDLDLLNKYFMLFPSISGKVVLDFEKKEKKNTYISLSSSHMNLSLKRIDNISFDNIKVKMEGKKEIYNINELSFWVDNQKNIFSGIVKFNEKSKKIEDIDIKGTINKFYSAFLVNFAVKDPVVLSGWFKGPFEFEYEKGKIYLSSDLLLWNTKLLLFSLGDLEISDVSGHATVKRNKIDINSFTGFVKNGGYVVMRGGIEDFLYRPIINFRFKMKNIYVPRIWYFSGVCDGDIKFERNKYVQKNLFSGDVYIKNGIIDGEFSDLFVSSGTKKLGGSDMNIHIVADKNFWLKNSNSDVEFTSDLYYKKERKSDSTYFSGKLSALKGTIYFMGVPFTIEKGDILFPNTNEELPDLNISATTYVYYKGKIDIFLQIKGNINDPQIILTSSEPTYTKNDIISLLIFNRPSKDIGNVDFINDKLGEYATLLLQKKLLFKFRKKRFIDTLNIRGNLISEDKYLDVEIGKYIGNNIFFLYKDDFIRNSERRFDVIYYLNKQFSFQTGIEDAKGDIKYNLDLKFKIKY